MRASVVAARVLGSPVWPPAPAASAFSSRLRLIAVAAASSCKSRVPRHRARSARQLLEPAERLVDLRGQAVRRLPSDRHVPPAGLGRNREAGGDEIGAEDARHLRDPGALAA